MAEELQTQDRPDQVDRILEIFASTHYLDWLDQVDRALIEAQTPKRSHIVVTQAGNVVVVGGNASINFGQAISDAWTPNSSVGGWAFGPQDLPVYQFAGREEERRTPARNTDPKKVEKLMAENSALHTKIFLLQAELRKNVPYLQLYRFGAGAFTLSVLSLLIWLFAGIAIPFHPAFALAAIPTSIGFMLMAYLTKKHKIDDTKMGNARAGT
jgi:hypothetical protein